MAARLHLVSYAGAAGLPDQPHRGELDGAATARRITGQLAIYTNAPSQIRHSIEASDSRRSRRETRWSIHDLDSTVDLHVGVRYSLQLYR